MSIGKERDLQLGLRVNRGQFALLILMTGFVGAMVGMERSILPALAEREFHLPGHTALLSFIVVFGVTKALTNYAAGRLSDRFGRRHVLIGGWLLALPVPFLLMWAPNWNGILLANALLGVSQGLTWSMAVIMKMDLVGSRSRGLATGLNEFAGYLGVALAALATGWIAARYGLRPEAFYPGIGFALLGVALSVLVIRETRGHALLESAQTKLPGPSARSARDVFWDTTLRNPTLSGVTQAGFVNNLNDGAAWGLFPILFAAAGMSLAQIGVLAAVYPAVWAVVQLGTGPLSDRIGRKWLIVFGMWVQAAALVVIALGSGFSGFFTGAVLLGIGTGMVYPALLATIGDVANPVWRASSLGVYRLWRDFGFAAGAVIAGASADSIGLAGAVWIVAGLTFASGLVAARRIHEARRLAFTQVPAQPAP